MNNIAWINDLKLKASFGEQGNDDIGNYYGWQSLFQFPEETMETIMAHCIPSLKTGIYNGRKTTNLNVGLDFSFLDRVTGTVEYFMRIKQPVIQCTSSSVNRYFIKLAEHWYYDK